MIHEIDPAALSGYAQDPVVPYSYAKRHGVLLLQQAEAAPLLCTYKAFLCPAVHSELLRIAINELKHDPQPNTQALEYAQVSEANFTALLSKLYQGPAESREAMEELGDDVDLAQLADQVPESEDLLEQQDDAPIIRLINAVLSQAIHEQASDIHIETFEKRVVIRFRVDGVMRKVLEPKRQLAPLLISRIKVMAKLDIAEKRIPQDGRISLKIAGREVDIRVSTLPATTNERIVLRLLDKQAGRLDINNLGLEQQPFQDFSKLLHAPHGIILVTGPTGSGKTTTLYSALSTLNTESRTILTVEDPIEYYLEGVGQTQVNPKTDMTFARGLRSILRQDPDVVMVGEIRDGETAHIAVQASLTGHLVLSTLHTNTAIGAIARLRDMGIEAFLLATSLIGLIAQRLVRRLCDQCKQQQPASPLAREQFGLADTDVSFALYIPVGCDQCNMSGFRGRLAIYEIIMVDHVLQKMIYEQAAEQDMQAYAHQHSLSIKDDGLGKVRQGITTLEEVMRVTQDR